MHDMVKVADLDGVDGLDLKSARKMTQTYVFKELVKLKSTFLSIILSARRTWRRRFTTFVARFTIMRTLRSTQMCLTWSRLMTGTLTFTLSRFMTGACA